MSGNVVIGNKTLECSGKLMASDVVVEVGGVTPTGETWVLNTGLNSARFDYAISFTSNETSFARILKTAPAGAELYYDRLLVYDGLEEDWPCGGAYRTITLDEPATGDFLTWLQANAVKQ